MKKIIFALSLSLILVPKAFAQEESARTLLQETSIYPYVQTFTITSYYSPVEGQERYVRGSLAADKKLNGNGTNGADGTPVFPGMIAAPKTIPFGTKMEIPGIGIVSVHDRGGAIVPAGQRNEKHDRLDIWMGYGDQGLSRALAWGKRNVSVTVYGPDDSLTENIELSGIDQLVDSLGNPSYEQKNFQLFRHDFGYGDEDPQITEIQNKLIQLGYLNQTATGNFDDFTYQAVLQFQLVNNIIDSENDFGAGYFGPQTRKTLEKALPEQVTLPTTKLLLTQALADQPDQEAKLIQLAGNGLSFLRTDLQAGDSGQSVIELQTELRKLNYFGIDPTGKYGELTSHAIFKFQQSQGLVTSETDLGAGILGPKTRTKLAAIIAARVENREKLKFQQKSSSLIAKR